MTRRPAAARTGLEDYIRSFDGAEMVAIAPHQFVNASLNIASKRKAGE